MSCQVVCFNRWHLTLTSAVFQCQLSLSGRYTQVAPQGQMSEIEILRQLAFPPRPKYDRHSPSCSANACIVPSRGLTKSMNTKSKIGLGIGAMVGTLLVGLLNLFRNFPTPGGYLVDRILITGAPTQPAMQEFSGPSRPPATLPQISFVVLQYCMSLIGCSEHFCRSRGILRGVFPLNYRYQAMSLIDPDQRARRAASSRSTHRAILNNIKPVTHNHMTRIGHSNRS